MKHLISLIFLILFTLVSFSQEICNNAIDDDGDGLIDFNDADCKCINSTGSIPSSLIPNPSFEIKNCCPSTFSEMNCADGWIQASDATADYINTCDIFFSGFSTTNLIPFPDGNGAAGCVVMNGYKEYIGACLSSPMIAGTQYTIKFDLGMIGLKYDANDYSLSVVNVTYLPSFLLTIFGAQTCGNIPFSGIECPPSNIFSELGNVAIINDGNYHNFTISFTPNTNISEIVIGSPCTLPSQYPVMDLSGTEDAPYFILDNLIINTSSSFDDISINQSGNSCNNNYLLTAIPTKNGGTFQWFKDGVALIGKTSSTLDFSTFPLVNGIYTVDYVINGNCMKSSYTVVDNSSVVNVTVNNGTINLNESVTLTASGANSYLWSPSTGLSSTVDSVVTANPSVTTIYTITGTKNGCKGSNQSTVTVIPNQNSSTIDSLNILYVPNSFTPNGDKFNNEFHPVFSIDMELQKYYLNIYNRWGEMIFESNDLTVGWNGLYHGQEVCNGVYYWSIYYKDSINGFFKEVKGSVNVLK